MTHPVLPKLKTGHTVTIFTKSGTWDVRQQDALEHLSKGLKVDEIETDLSSIPDMWARPILFEMALLNPKHVLHARILGEWRGLLAMLALKDVLGLNGLAAAAVTLPSAAKSQGESAESSPAQNVNRDFLQTLTRLLPTASLAADTSWQYLYAFLFDGKPVGMTSPTTLVATAADYLNRINSQEVRWYDGTRLLDPVKVLASRQKEILAGWLDRLIAQMSAHRGLDANRWNLLVGLLRAFSKALGPGSANVGHTSLGIRGQEAGFFKYLDRPADAATDGKDAKDASHVCLIPSEGRSPQKPLFVVDRSIADQWNMALQDVTVYAAQTLDTVKIRIDHADVWSGTDFFTKELFVIFQESAFPGAAGAGHQLLKLPGGTTSITPILPIEPALLEHLTAEDLARRVRWEQVQDGLKLHLSLQLTGTDAGTAPGRSIELTKLYKREAIRTLDNVPILEIWPDFIAPGWQAYYTCYSTDDATITFEAAPWGARQVEHSEVPLGGQRRRRYWLGNSYPEAMVCRATLANERTGQMEVHDAGLLLLSRPKDIQPQGNTCKVGVDFGASGTTICVSTDRAPVKFHNRKVSVTASGANAQAQLFDFFLPRQPSDMPVLSFFHDFANNLDGRELRPLLDGHAYLLETEELFRPETRGLAFDLKWSREGADRRRVRAFLTQLCLQTAAELVAQGAVAAQWAFSYPTAFNDEQRQGFPAIWQQVIDHCSARSGLRQVQPLAQLTESEAAALYFVNHCHAATAVGTIFIDIGGSTSDVSVWQGNQPVWQTSVLLAGRSIFSNYLWHNPGFLGLFGVEDAKRLPALKEMNKNDRRSYHAFTDAILRYKTPQIFQALPLLAGDVQVKALRQHLALGICGLFFYVGSLLRHLTESGRYRREVPNVYVGGNGSRVLRWLDIDGDGRINAMYKALFSRGAGWSDEKPFSVILSPEPKSEAAYGLISDNAVHRDGITYPVLAGETFSAEESIDELPATHCLQQGDTRELPWDIMLTPAVFTSKLAPPQRMARFAEFIDAFNQFARGNSIVTAVDTDHAQLEEVRRRLGQSLSRYRGNVRANVVVEPVFIMALRHWLEIKLDG